jgi:hypothetical protein
MKRGRDGKERDVQTLQTLYPAGDEPHRANRQDSLGQDLMDESRAKAEQPR